MEKKLPGSELMTSGGSSVSWSGASLMFSAMVLKGLPPTFGSIATALNFGPQKGYEEMMQDLINFANTRAEPGTDVASTAFHSSGGNSSRKITCFKCKRRGTWRGTAGQRKALRASGRHFLKTLVYST